MSNTKVVEKTVNLSTKWADFLKKVSVNSPLKNNYKYAYKPFLILSIIANVKPEDVFNKWIKINGPIAKTFYDFNVENDSYFSQLLKSSPSKKEWEVGFNDLLERQIISLINKNPAHFLSCDVWKLDKKNKSVFIAIENLDTSNCLEALKEASLLAVKKCIPEYKSATLNDFVSSTNFDSYYQNLILNSQINSTEKGRKFQHIFSKKVKDRDKKCVICGLESNYLLEAAHIKPFSKCATEQEKYSENNGITLCKNHHKMFDLNDFAWNMNGTIEFSQKINLNDKNILFGSYDKALKVICDYNKKYFEFQYQEIFKKNKAFQN